MQTLLAFDRKIGNEDEKKMKVQERYCVIVNWPIVEYEKRIELVKEMIKVIP